MQIATKIWDSGWGAVFLTIYGFVIIHIVVPDQHLFKSIAILPTIMVMFIADRYNFHITHFFAGGELQRSTEQIDRTTGEQDFYESASEELQARINDFDRRAYQNNISILVGLFIATTSPFIGFYLQGSIGVIVGVGISGIAIQLLTRRSVQQLNTLAQNITEPYAAKYEN